MQDIDYPLSAILLLLARFINGKIDLSFKHPKYPVAYDKSNRARKIANLERLSPISDYVDPTSRGQEHTSLVFDTDAWQEFDKARIDWEQVRNIII